MVMHCNGGSIEHLQAIGYGGNRKVLAWYADLDMGGKFTLDHGSQSRRLRYRTKRRTTTKSIVIGKVGRTVGLPGSQGDICL
jgi:hypothetical protein